MMRAVVIYESMYGNTHHVADAIANGLAGVADVEVLPLEDANVDLLRAADLVVVGGPTHVHGLSRESTRNAAVESASKSEDLELDPDAPGIGLREWFASLPQLSADAAAFDTRLEANAIITGRASKGIARRLRKHGFEVVAEPESFLVTKRNTLVAGEADRARAWAERLAAKVAPQMQ
jgi:Flavodoxin domain